MPAQGAGIRVQTETGEAVEQPADGDHPFKAAQRCTDTVVDPVSECQVTAGLASDTELGGIRESVTVTVGREQRDVDKLPGWDLGIADTYWLGDEPESGIVDRSVSGGTLRPHRAEATGPTAEVLTTFNSWGYRGCEV